MAALHWSLRWPWSRKGEPKGPKTVNIFLGFFFVINYSLGTGFLGIPYSFYYAGYLAAIPTLLLVVFVAWNAVRWELEVMARAQVRRLVHDGGGMNETLGKKWNILLCRFSLQCLISPQSIYHLAGAPQALHAGTGIAGS